VLAAAVTAVLREGQQVPMATIAAEAGVGIGTLYRRYADREALLAALSHRAFQLVLEFAENADGGEGPALSGLRAFFDLVISHRDQLVLPLHGGPVPVDAATRAVRSKLHRVLGRILERGGTDGSIRTDATTRDVIVFGALLSQPLPNSPDWEQTAQSLKIIFLDGLGAR
jgi:AcrR family transcriptional regulator